MPWYNYDANYYAKRFKKLVLQPRRAHAEIVHNQSINQLALWT